MLRPGPTPSAAPIALFILISLIPARPAVAVVEAPGTGELLAFVEGGGLVPMPIEHTDVRAEITGHIARVEVTQVFSNPFDVKIEAVYVFPLAEDAAVDGMEIRLDDRTVRGVIRKREEALQEYLTAREAGYVAALLDQERPNIFTQSLANIMPGERIEVGIRYFETLPNDGDRYTFAFPMVVGPRFHPGSRGGEGGAAGPGGPAAAPPDGPAPEAGDPDGARTESAPVSPPILPPGFRSGHDISLAVRLDAGTSIRDLRAPSHRVETSQEGTGRATVRLAPDDAIPNKDFVLHYEVGGAEPEVVVLPHRVDGDGYFLMQIRPGEIPADPVFMPKEMIFIVDCSGSMSGEPIARVREAMRYALENLHPLDNFQIIRFSDEAQAFADRPVPATPQHVARGLRFIESLSGHGGTIMKDGIAKALRDPDDPQRLRIVSLMTDGFIDNEREVLADIERHLGQARLFPFGVGSSPNRYLIDELAFMGRGAPAYVPLTDRNGEAIRRFYDRIRSPYLTHIELEWGVHRMERLTPARIPDLFVGRPITVLGRYASAGIGEVTLRARLGGRPFTRTYRVILPEREESGSAIASLWAREVIADLSRRNLVEHDPARVEAITDLALAHNLMSAYTSFVAVEDWIPTVPEGPERVDVELPLPAGMEEEVERDGDPDGGVAVDAGVLTPVDEAATLDPPSGRSGQELDIESIPEIEVLTGGTSGIRGLILDRDGRPVPGATVLVRNSRFSPRGSVTDANGEFHVAPLKPGRGYELTISFPGMSSVRVPDLEIRAGRTTRVPVTLRPDTELQESVRVVGATGLGDRAAALTTTAYSEAFIESLPILGRNYQDVLALGPGVSGVHRLRGASKRPLIVSSASAAFRRSGFVNVRGARDTDAVTLVDSLAVVEANEPAAAVRLEPIRSRFRASEPVTVLLTIENVSDEAIELPSDLSIEGGTIHLEVRDVEGNPVPGSVDRSVATVPIVLEPGETITIPLRIDGPDGWALRRPGRYTVRFVGAPIGLPDATTEVILKRR